MSTRKPIKRLKIEMNIWGNFKAYHGPKAISMGGDLYYLAGDMHNILTKEEADSVEFYGTYGEEFRKYFDKYRNL